MTVAAILLAAGESKRMGMPKPLLEWGGHTLIEYQVAQLKGPPIDEVVVVLGHQADRIAPLVRQSGIRVVINEGYSEGRASSLRVGAAALGVGIDAVLVLNVDAPRPHWIIARLVEEHLAQGSLITVPVYRGERGHPSVLAGSLLPELREVRDESLGLRAILERHAAAVREIPFDLPVVLLNINDPGQYLEARTSYFGG